MDLHTLVKRDLSWDDVIPDDLRSVWVLYFEMMQEIGNLRFQRVVVPEDAVNHDINTADAADARDKMACVAIYARFLWRTDTYSCQLVFSRSKVVPDGLSQPKAELLAAAINAHTGETIKRAFGQSQRTCQIE